MLCNLSLDSAFGPWDCLITLQSRPLWTIFIMVRRRMGSHFGGSRGGQGKWPTPSSVDPAHNPISSHRFQTSHFTFQSNLNRPVITANITILFSEEEAPPLIRVHLMSEPPLEAFREASSQSNRQVTTGESLEKDQGKRLERSEAPSTSRPSETVVLRILEEMDSDTRPFDEAPK